jgi:hypothetical protein
MSDRGIVGGAEPEASRELSEAARESMLRAVELNDGLVQLLAIARYALDAGDIERAREAIDGSLERARNLMSALLSTSGFQMRPGDLRRVKAAGEGASEPEEREPAR